MKKLLIAVVLLSSLASFAQSTGIGIKGGFNYGSVGDLNLSSEISNMRISPDNKVGYHFGLFGKFEVAGLFIQPEVLYTKLKTAYVFGEGNESTEAEYGFSKIDVPVLLGLNILGPINIKAGPSFQYVLDNEFESDDTEFNISEPENEFTVGYQLGVGATLGQLGIDLRYEGAFQENDVVSSGDVQDAGFNIDSRPSQWIVSLSYSFGKD